MGSFPSADSNSTFLNEILIFFIFSSIQPLDASDRGYFRILIKFLAKITSASFEIFFALPWLKPPKWNLINNLSTYARQPADGYTTEDLVFQWKSQGPVQVTSNLHLPRFTLKNYYTNYCTSKTNTGKSINF